MSLANPSNKTVVEVSAQSIKDLVPSIRNTLLNSHIDIFKSLWFTEGASPEDILSELGGNAAELFYQGGINCRFLALIDAHPEKWGAIIAAMDSILQDNELSVPIPPEWCEPLYPYSVNPNGTVTLDISNGDE